MDKLERQKELIRILNYHRKKYYDEDDNVISDKEYDELYKELEELEKETGFVADNSPTRLVGGSVDKKFLPYKHKQRLYSLDKCQSFEEFLNWEKRTEKQIGSFDYTLEYKYDGLSVNVFYSGGNFVKASTRGDGITGEEITEQIKTVKELPLKIPYKGDIEIQGECIMRLSDFNEYNRTHDKTLKNPRNAAAGALRNLDINITRSRKLSLIFYNIGYSKDRSFSSQLQMYEFIKENGFPSGDFFKVIKDKNILNSELKNIEKERDGLDYLIDGAVIKVNDTALREELGFTDKFPKWAIAYKFEAEEESTVLKDVIWQVSRTGKINPLAILEPIELGGATIKRATLNNYADILKKDIKINSRVFVRRSNDVIPEVTSNAEHFANSVDIKPPDKCPVCKAAVIKKGAFYYCSNTENCAPRIISALAHFASKEAMDIEGLSEKTCELLYNELNVKNFTDIYKLKKEDLLELEGFKDKKAENLIASIKASKNVPLYRFITALGIPTIGKKNAKTLADKFKNLNRLINVKEEELKDLNDFGEIMAKSVAEYFADGKNLQLIKDLSQYLNFIEEESNQGIFSDITVLITGKLNGMSRDKAYEEIKRRGGQTSDTVSKKVNLLIVGEDAGSKLEKAKKLGIRIISQEEFFQMLNQ